METRISHEKARLRAQKIKLLILDVDGVMTDGSIYLDNRGNEMKSFYVRDGHGIKMAQKAGLSFAIITGRESQVVERRAKELAIEELYQGVKDKAVVYKNLLARCHYKNEEIAFMGDDIVDLPIMTNVGLPAAPADADDLVREYALFVSQKKGGQGAVRELIEFILKSTSRWDSLIKDYCA